MHRVYSGCRGGEEDASHCTFRNPSPHSPKSPLLPIHPQQYPHCSLHCIRFRNLCSNYTSPMDSQSSGGSETFWCLRQTGASMCLSKDNALHMYSLVFGRRRGARHTPNKIHQTPYLPEPPLLALYSHTERKQLILLHLFLTSVLDGILLWHAIADLSSSHWGFTDVRRSHKIQFHS